VNTDPDTRPTVRRRRLAAELRRLRVACDLTRDEVAKRLEWSPSKMTRLESGQFARVNPRDVRDLLDVYGVAGEAEREAYVRLAKESRQRGWWSAYSGLFNSTYLGLESDADEIRTYEAELVPGLLQTEAYSRAIYRAGRLTDTEDEIERRAAARMTRQQVLGRDEPPLLWSVLNEAVLHRLVGGPGILRDQLFALVEATQDPKVILQVLPYSVGAHAGMDGSFVILAFGELADPDVVFTESRMSGAIFEATEQVATYNLAFDHLRASACPPADSIQMIITAAKEL